MLLFSTGAVAKNPEISDLVGWMVSHRFEDRPAIEETLNHPFLWSPAKRMQFLTDVGNKVEQFKDQLENVCWVWPEPSCWVV